MIRRVLPLIVALSLPTTPAAAVTLATDGKPGAVIVLPAESIPAERTAAGELADYLGKATGGKFNVLSEAEVPKDGPCIFVGGSDDFPRLAPLLEKTPSENHRCHP